MGTHKKNINFTQSDLFFWNGAWKYFSKSGFIICPAEFEVEDVAGENQMFSSSLRDGRAVQHAPSLQYIFNFINDMKRNIETQVNTAEFSWNYLGNSEEKDLYIDYLKSIFWTIQNDERVQSMEDFSEVLESPWKVTRWADDLGLKLSLAGDTFNDKTLGFIDGVDQKLKGWNIEPFLINHESATFHWEIVAGNKYFFSGYVTKEDKQLVNHISYYQEL